MKTYILIAVLIRFLADFLLIMAVNRLIGFPESPIRGLVGSTAAALYALGNFLLPWQFLKGPVCYGISLLVTCLLAFGWQKNKFRKWLVFFLLRLGLDGIAAGRGMVPELLGTVLIWGVCLYGFANGREKCYIPVELHYGQKQVALQALYDTGHQLQDPVTGKPILVVGADIADRLTGLTPQQLKRPVEMIGSIPGLRLIPYQTIGRSGELILAMQLEHTKIGKKKGSYLVAFAPQVLDGTGNYQGLIGGIV